MFNSGVHENHGDWDSGLDATFVRCGGGNGDGRDLKMGQVN